MEKIGTICLLQIQQHSLKRENGAGDIVYDSEGIVALNEIRLTTFGIVGRLDFPRRDMTLLDVHHLRHPQSRFRGDNKISLGFTSHYRQLRAEFGAHLRDGRAGENIIVKCERTWTRADLGSRLLIRSAKDNGEIRLGDIKPIPPCEPFARFARRQSSGAAQTKADLQLLSGGMRGYYMEIESAAEAIVRHGDSVFRVGA